MVDGKEGGGLQGVAALSTEGGSPENRVEGTTRGVKERKDKGEGGITLKAHKIRGNNKKCPSKCFSNMRGNLKAR